MKKRKAFTIVELVVTIGILALAFGLTAGLVAAMNGVQKSNSSLTNKTKELSLFYDRVSEYVSFVSLNTDEISFTYDSANSTENKVVFNYSTYHFDLCFDDSALFMTSNYDGINSYFKKTFYQNLESIQSVTFKYTSSLGQLISTVSAGGSTFNYSHIVRTVL